jgi:hypothetical protein
MRNRHAVFGEERKAGQRFGIDGNGNVGVDGIGKYKFRCVSPVAASTCAAGHKGRGTNVPATTAKAAVKTTAASQRKGRVQDIRILSRSSAALEHEIALRHRQDGGGFAGQ